MCEDRIGVGEAVHGARAVHKEATRDGGDIQALPSGSEDGVATSDDLPGDEEARRTLDSGLSNDDDPVELDPETLALLELTGC